jgi:DNA-binding MarR family transcriptional regulator
VKLAFMAMRRQMYASLRASGLTITQWRALGVLDHQPGATHSDLMRELEIEAPSVTSLVNGMQRRGWVRQQRSPSDARVKKLFLTAGGRRVIEKARTAFAPVEAGMESALPRGEREELKRLLTSLIEAMR